MLMKGSTENGLRATPTDIPKHTLSKFYQFSVNKRHRFGTPCSRVPAPTSRARLQNRCFPRLAFVLIPILRGCSLPKRRTPLLRLPDPPANSPCRIKVQTIHAINVKKISLRTWEPTMKKHRRRSAPYKTNQHLSGDNARLWCTKMKAVSSGHVIAVWGGEKRRIGIKERSLLGERKKKQGHCWWCVKFKYWGGDFCWFARGFWRHSILENG